MASKGYGANVHHGSGTPPVITSPTVLAAAITEIVPPVIECDDIEDSHMATTDMTRSYQAGWIEGGELEVTAHYDKTEYAAMLAIFGTSKTWRITLNDSASGTDSGVLFVGYIKALGPTIDMEGLIECTITIKVTSKPVHDLDISA